MLVGDWLPLLFVLRVIDVYLYVDLYFFGVCFVGLDLVFRT